MFLKVNFKLLSNKTINIVYLYKTHLNVKLIFFFFKRGCSEANNYILKLCNDNNNVHE